MRNIVLFGLVAFVAGGHWTAVCWQNFQEWDTHRWVRHLKSLIDVIPCRKMDPHDEFHFLGLHHNLWVNWQGIDEQLAAFG